MVELGEKEFRTNENHSSKGNQLKWNKDGVWYKADYTGYEGMSEYVISQLLAKSSLMPNEYVMYDTEQISYKHSVFKGAKSRDFLNDGFRLITLNRLYNIKYNRDFTRDLWHITDLKERLSFLTQQVIRMTNLTDFGIYISKMLTVDALFLNEDRHLHNIAVLMGPDDKFDYCPLFDNGAGLLADTTVDYPLNVDVYELIKDVKAKTICSSFDEALDVAAELYGKNISFSFSQKDVSDILEKESIYDAEIKNRVEKIVFEQMRKYKYLFS